jgi:two-component sensor histidine kinase
MSDRMDRNPQKILKYVTYHSQYVLVACLIVLAIFTFRLTNITAHVLGKSLEEGQHVRGVLKVSQIYERGVSLCLMGLTNDNNEQFYAGLDQIEASHGYLAIMEYYLPDDLNYMASHIDETITEFERLHKARVEEDLSVTDMSINRIFEISSSFYEFVGGIDSKNFIRFTKNNGLLAARFKQYSRLLVLLNLFMFVLVILLLSVTSKRSKAELALREAHDGLERRVGERTEELQVSLQDKDTLLGEKDLLLKEVHHRVKNNLQAISGLFDIQEAYLDDATISGLFRETQNRIMSMALIHEKLYQMENISDVNFEGYVKTLTRHLIHSHGKSSESITMTTEISDVHLNVETAISCGLIINELVTNSLKYAFTGGGDNKITIEVRQDGNGAYVMIISDNGVGLGEEFDPGRSKTLGLQLVNSLVEQLSGTIEFESDNGTKVNILFREHHECHTAAL